MKTLYLDIFSGISGDMFLGALIDLGLDATYIEAELRKLNIPGWHIHVAREKRFEIEGTKFNAHIHEDGGNDHHHHSHDGGHHHHHSSGILPTFTKQEHTHGRTYSEIIKLIDASPCSDWVKEKSKAVFHRIGVAEGKIHGMPVAEVHFHEVGALDSIIDIIGACIGLEQLGKPRVLASAITEGTGWINCAHGRFPIPAPATLEIFANRGIFISQCDEPHELVTPTGAAILAEFVEAFGPLQNFKPEKIGFGIGTRHNKTRPNVLRAVLGETSAASAAYDWERDEVTLIETNLDDCSSEIIGAVIEKALSQGALDAFITPIQMKKNRPAVILSILCASGDADKFSELLLRETTAFGIRRTQLERRKLMRDFAEVKTRYGIVKIKTGSLNGKIIQAAPEFESCLELAEQHNIAVKDIFTAAMAAWEKQNAKS